MVVLDCGVMFPDPDMPGIDLVLPDFSYLRDHADAVEGIVLTHGHEDHTGGLAYLLRDLGSRSTAPRSRSAWPATGWTRPASRTGPRSSRWPTASAARIGPFEVEFIPVTHSVPHGFATAFYTPQGVILHTGDFKIDLTPVDGRLTDLARIGAIAAGPGVRLLLSDSTNAEEPGFTAVGVDGRGRPSRGSSRPATDRRIIVTCFASHIHRVQQVVDAAVEGGRKVATLGRSMGKNLELARRLGILHIDDASLVDIEDVDDLEPGEVCVLSTGSQGEPLSALSLLAAGESKWLHLVHGRRRGHQRPPDPGQRVGGGPGHRPAAPARAPRSSTPASSRCT